MLALIRGCKRDGLYLMSSRESRNESILLKRCVRWTFTSSHCYSWQGFLLAPIYILFTSPSLYIYTNSSFVFASTSISIFLCSYVLNPSPPRTIYPISLLYEDPLINLAPSLSWQKAAGSDQEEKEEERKTTPCVFSTSGCGFGV